MTVNASSANEAGVDAVGEVGVAVAAPAGLIVRARTVTAEAEVEIGTGVEAVVENVALTANVEEKKPVVGAETDIRAKAKVVSLRSWSKLTHADADISLPYQSQLRLASKDQPAKPLMTL